MSWWYRHLIRPVLFTQEAEQAHERTLRALEWVSGKPLFCDALESFFGAPQLPVELFGLQFPNPVGLAGGMDKQADALPAWAALGFGFTELGAVTWQAQAGNPPPRLFRAVAAEAIVNRMGFNNPGADAMALKLIQWRQQGRWPRHPVAINLGKSKITPLLNAAEDYANSFRSLRAHADFFIVNVSSPNTPGLRQLQDKEALDEILAAIQEVQSDNGPIDASRAPQVVPAQGAKPILLKVAPDLSFEALDEILEVILRRNISGIVATNTTVSRPPVTDPQLRRVYGEAGGLSGRPLRQRSTEVVQHLYRQTRGQVPIIGVGGVFNAEDAWEKILAGASLVQLYTGLVYEGPAIVQRIVRGLCEKLESAGLRDLAAAVGAGAK